MNRQLGWLSVCTVAVMVLGAGWSISTAQPPAGAANVDPAALGRGRKTVKMLDEIYKTCIVTVTDKYVQKDSDIPAGTVFTGVFAAVSKNGSHTVRLIDVTGQPYGEKNVAKDDFEKAAVAALKSGKDGFEQVEQRDGKPWLRSATPVPVVMKKCVMCHANYEQAKPGAAIGAMVYAVPIE